MCLWPRRILSAGEWWRLLAPVIMHADDMHLYYNMVSFIYKVFPFLCADFSLQGRHLERRFGSCHFLVVLLLFSIASTVTTVALSFGLDTVFPGSNFMSQCAVGFSGLRTFLMT